MKNTFLLFCIIIVISCKTKSKKAILKHHVSIEVIDSSIYDCKKANTLSFAKKKHPKSKDFIVELSNKRKLYFKNNEGTPYDENRVNYFLDSISINKLLVNVKEYEDNYYLLIDKSNSKVDTLPDYPHFSIKKDKIFVSNFNPYESYKEYIPPTEDIYIYKYKKNNLEKVFERPFHYFSDTYLESFYWKDNKTIYLKFVNEQNENMAKYISLFIEEK